MAKIHFRKVASPKRFDFEAVAFTKDSDYLGVKRMAFKMTLMPADEKNSTKTIVLKNETIEILPNAKFQLTLQNKLSGHTSALEIDLCKIANTTEAEDLFKIEVGLRINWPTITQRDVKYFMVTHGKINILLAPLEIKMKSTNMPYMHVDCTCIFEIVLKVPNDLNSPNTAISKLFSEGEFTDACVEINCGEQMSFNCHKCLLAENSDVFKALLYTNKGTENTTETICVDDIDAKTMKTLIKYLYHDKITYKEATDLNLIVAANKYNIVDLFAKCEKIIILTMSMTNIMDVLAVSKLLPTLDLFEKATLFYNQNFGQKNNSLKKRSIPSTIKRTKQNY
jgi:hypothetical protein